MSKPSTAKQIEAYLLYKNEPVSRKVLVKTFGITAEECSTILESLRIQREDSGIVLLDDGEKVMLGTHPDTENIIQSLQKKELESNISKSARETLSIILYLGPVSKADIDFLRGVNAQFILRRLSMRGLIALTDDKKWSATVELLAHLGVTHITELQEYQAIHADLGERLAYIKRRLTGVEDEQEIGSIE